MKISTTKFEGLLIFEPTVFNDSRGYFFESFSENKLIDAIYKALKYDDEVLIESFLDGIEVSVCL